jgi:hypothetical protein
VGDWRLANGDGASSVTTLTANRLDRPEASGYNPGLSGQPPCLAGTGSTEKGEVARLGNTRHQPSGMSEAASAEGFVRGQTVRTLQDDQAHDARPK